MVNILLPFCIDGEIDITYSVDASLIRPSMKRIVHIDLDAFFASVEELQRPELRQKPVIVGNDPRGVVSSCNYIARRFGIHAAMPVVEARRRCPKGVFVAGSYGLYHTYSQRVFSIIGRYTPVVEKTGIDEGYADITGTALLHRRSYAEIVQHMRRAIHKETGLVVSCGLATTKVFAKIGGKLAKPNGFYTTLPSQEVSMLHQLPIRYLPGMGGKAGERCQELRIHTIGAFAALEKNYVARYFGELGLALYELAWNRDNRVVNPFREEQKSMSKDETFAHNIFHLSHLELALRDLMSSLLFRLRTMKKVATSVQVKVKDIHHVVRQRSYTLVRPSALDQEIFPVVLRLLRLLWKPGVGLRQLGISVSGLQESPAQLSLWGWEERLGRLVHATDELRQRFGKHIITQGLSRSLFQRGSPGTFKL